MWRDFNGDFGRDVLREHVAAFHLGDAARDRCYRGGAYGTAATFVRLTSTYA